MDVQLSFIGRRAEEQTAWSVLVVRVVFDDFTTSDCFPYLLYTDTSQDALVDSVPGELELIRFDLFA